MTAKARVGLLGSTGRMGRIVKQVLASDYADRAELVAEASDQTGVEPLLSASLDVVIEFSLPEAAASFLKAAQKTKIPPALVVASTGWPAASLKSLDAYADRAPVIVAANYSLGVLALQRILGEAAPLLQKLGYTPVLTEAHHRHKRDAPSGTAVALQKILAPKKPDSVQTHSIRAGEVIGDHAVAFYGPADTITISHSAADRSIFARGAIESALWLADKRRKKKTGMFSLAEVVGEA